jgi:putative phage-type endonuclease
MKIVTIIQNTPEWEALRESRLGASDANIIMGVSEYETIRGLWLIKSGQKKKEEDGNDFAQAKGHRLELKNRAMLELEMGVDFPPMTVLSDDYPFLMASLDGIATVEKTWVSDDYSDPASGGNWIEDHHYVLGEFKYCGQDDFNLVKAGHYLPQYYPQCQQQLLLTGARYLILGVCTEDLEAIKAQIAKDKAAGIEVDAEEYKTPKIYKYARVQVNPDLIYMEKTLLPALINFHQAVITKTDPGYGPRDVKDESSNEYLADALSRYKLMKEDLENTAALVEKTKKEIFGYCSHTKSVCGNAQIMVIQKSAPVITVIDYEKFIKDKGLTIPAEYIRTETGLTPAPIEVIKFVKTEEEKAQEAKEKEEQKALIQAEKDRIKKEKEEAKAQAATDKKAAAEKKAQDRIDELRRKEEEKKRIKEEKEKQKLADKEAKAAAKAAAKGKADA